MTGDAFFAADPAARTSWRQAILMGTNSRTYKFALGRALLVHARTGRTEVPLRELARTYAMELVEHLRTAPQAPEVTSMKETDFLSVATAESEASLAAGEPTERLVESAMRSMPGMVMRKFHNLRNGSPIAHTFYELIPDSRPPMVRLLPDLLRVAAQSEQVDGLLDELTGRWNIVECSFTTGIGRSLVTDGMAVDWATETLTDKRRRRSVTGVREAVLGFQHGRCLICDNPIGPSDKVAIDHVFPYVIMERYGGVSGWAGPDLDAVWNLAPAHQHCNAEKSDAFPGPELERRLVQRNEAIMSSLKPLSRALRLALGRNPGGADGKQWTRFVHEVRSLCR